MAVDDNLLLQNANLSIIEAAEKQLGNLVKLEKDFVDVKTGSTFRLEFAASSQKKIEDFLSNHNVEFKGIGQSEKEQLIAKMGKNKVTSDLIKAESVNLGNDDFSIDEVFYDLKAKTLKGGAVGYSFAMKPLVRVENVISGKNLRPNGLNWCQQTSLPWCEYATIAMISEQNPQSYPLYQQTRGVFWSGSGNSMGNVTTGGNQYDAYVDGPKYTRFGGYDPLVSKIDFVIWFDLESNSSITVY